MTLTPVALFVGDLTGAPPEAKVRRRHRKKGLSSQVACTVEERSGAYFAVPVFVPPIRRRAHYRWQLRVPLIGGRPDEIFAIVVQPQFETRAKDIEQMILAPIYCGPDRMIVEFQRAEVVWCRADGSAGLRLAAIDAATGQVGTRNASVDPDRYEAIVSRCRGQLEGAPLLFPPRHDLHRRASRIPKGMPELSFALSEP